MGESEPVLVRPSISIIKGVKLFALVAGAGLVTPEVITNFLPNGYGELTVAAVLAAVINYVKTRYKVKL